MTELTSSLADFSATMTDTPAPLLPALPSLPTQPSELRGEPRGDSQPAGVTAPSERDLLIAPLKTTRVWGLDFARVDMDQIIQRADRIVATRSCRYFITANLNYLMLSHQLPELAVVNQAADAIIADGNPAVIRSRLESEPLPCRVAGADMIVELARLAADRGYRMFFLGAAPGVAAQAAAKLQCMFPSLQIAGCYAPPFRPLSELEHRELLSQVTDSRTDILLVAFGQPKGELWIHENYRQLGVPLSIQLGASFDFLAGTTTRAPAFWQAIGCEWLYRSLCEPRRLAPRYLRNIAFLLRCLARDMRGIFSRRN
ncbi:MAG: WecB/TagA/CpsF family glycosyltransferase [Aureliella sp.]